MVDKFRVISALYIVAAGSESGQQHYNKHQLPQTTIRNISQLQIQDLAKICYKPEKALNIEQR